MIVVQLATHIEPAVGQRIVEEAKAALCVRPPRHIKRNVFIERVGSARAIAHRIDIAHFIALARTINRSGTLAQANIHFTALAFDVVIDPGVPPREVVRLRLAIPQNTMPFAVLA